MEYFFITLALGVVIWIMVKFYTQTHTAKYECAFCSVTYTGQDEETIFKLGAAHNKWHTDQRGVPPHCVCDLIIEDGKVVVRTRDAECKSGSFHAPAA